MVCILDTQLNTESAWVPYADPPFPISGIPTPFPGSIPGLWVSLSEEDPMVVGSQAWVSRVGLL